MKGLIIYKGKYGATDQYAQWLGKAVGFAAFEPEQVSNTQLQESEVLIMGTSVYIGKFQLRNWLQTHVSQLLDKKLYLFVVAGTPVTEKEKLESYITANVPDEIRRKTEVFFLPGKLNYASLSWLDKMLLRMGAAFTQDPVQKKRMLTDYNEVKQAHLKTMILSVGQYTGKQSENSLYTR